MSATSSSLTVSGGRRRNAPAVAQPASAGLRPVGPLSGRSCPQARLLARARAAAGRAPARVRALERAGAVLLSGGAGVVVLAAAVSWGAAARVGVWAALAGMVVLAAGGVAARWRRAAARHRFVEAHRPLLARAFDRFGVEAYADGGDVVFELVRWAPVHADGDLLDIAFDGRVEREVRFDASDLSAVMAAEADLRAQAHRLQAAAERAWMLRAGGSGPAAGRDGRVRAAREYVERFAADPAAGPLA